MVVDQSTPTLKIPRLIERIARVLACIRRGGQCSLAQETAPALCAGGGGSALWTGDVSSPAVFIVNVNTAKALPLTVAADGPGRALPVLRPCIAGLTSPPSPP